MATATRTFDLPVVKSWFQGGTKHHIYVKAPLARALGAPDAKESVAVAVYVEGANVARGKLLGKTWFLTEVDAVFQALAVGPADVDKRSVIAQGRSSPDGQRLDLHLWLPTRAPPPHSPSAEHTRSADLDQKFLDLEDYLDDDHSDESVPEGAVRQILVNVYERSAELRRKCIEHWGTQCIACKFDFGSRYGHLGEGFTHVHHLTPLAETAANHEVDPINDLRPLCANCHAIVHRRRPALSLGELVAAISAPSS